MPSIASSFEGIEWKLSNTHPKKMTPWPCQQNSLLWSRLSPLSPLFWLFLHLGFITARYRSNREMECFWDYPRTWRRSNHIFAKYASLFLARFVQHQMSLKMSSIIYDDIKIFHMLMICKFSVLSILSGSNNPFSEE